MTKGEIKNVGASVRARLHTLARDRNEDFQLVLLRYANERFLYRLSVSRHAASFVLKGAALFALWTGKPHRATRDLDFLGFGDSAIDHLRETFAEITALSVEDDGVQFDLESLKAEPIREEQQYGGVRIIFNGRIDSAQVRMQMDVAFGDAITPGDSLVEYPALLAFPAPRIRAYPRETVIAEKIEAMTQLGMANTRVKDLYDVVLLSRMFAFDGAVLVRAIRTTFDRRGTSWPASLPAMLTSAFAEDMQKKAQWSGFLRKAGITDGGSSDRRGEGGCRVRRPAAQRCTCFPRLHEPVAAARSLGLRRATARAADRAEEPRCAGGASEVAAYILRAQALNGVTPIR